MMQTLPGNLIKGREKYKRSIMERRDERKGERGRARSERERGEIGERGREEIEGEREGEGGRRER